MRCTASPLAAPALRVPTSRAASRAPAAAAAALRTSVPAVRVRSVTRASLPGGSLGASVSPRGVTRVRPSAASGDTALTATTPELATALTATMPELAALAGCTVVSVSSGEAVAASSLVAPTGTTLLPFLTHTADFDSWELSSKLVDYLPALDAAGVRVACVCIGSRDAAKAFAAFTRFPEDRLYADAPAACYAALRFAPGAGRPGGPAPFLAPASGMAKLMAMCAGIGSPGTLPEVFRGYLVRCIQLC